MKKSILTKLISFALVCVMLVVVSVSSVKSMAFADDGMICLSKNDNGTYSEVSGMRNNFASNVY